MDLSRDNPGPHFLLKGDVSKAHRRVRVCRRDWGLQACRLLDDDTVWLNTVGTFGIGSAGYFWSRALAVIARVLLCLLGKADIWQLIFVDDFSWHLYGPDFEYFMWFIILFYSVLRVPFAWHKFQGGQEYEWVGFWINIKVRSTGLSQKRKSWLIQWIDQTSQDKAVLVRNVSEVLGRLQFASLAIPILRPFLGFLYAWVASLPLSTTAPLPISLRLVLGFIKFLLERGNALSPVLPRLEAGRLLFRADAKAEGNDVALGGWLCHPEGPAKSLWYAVRITPSKAPWAYWAGEAYKTIASLELFATLVCIMVFTTRVGAGGVIEISGETDNRDNSFVVEKLMSVQLPLNVVLMELAFQLHERGLSLDLKWVPRDDNVEADSLSNFCSDDFQPENRISVDIGNLGFAILPSLMAEGEQMYKDLSERKLANRRAVHASRITVPGNFGRKRKRPPASRLKNAQPW